MIENIIWKRDFWDKIDLHIHSNFSDSNLSINEIVEISKKKNLDYISITDHDTTEQCQYIDNYDDITILNGIEISSFDKDIDKEIHVLGYDFKLPAENINKIIKKTNKRRNKLSLKQIDILKKLGYKIDEKSVMKYVVNSKAIYKQHILHYLFDNGLIDEMFGEFYKTVYKTRLKKQLKLPKIKDVIDAIHKDGGLAFIAHPFMSNCETELSKYVTMGIDGIEVKHSYSSDEEIEFLYYFCIKNNLLMSKGSDNHGLYGNEAEIGY